jgi:hypothetical protein
MRNQRLARRAIRARGPGARGKGYRYQFVFARNAGHTDRTVKQQTLPAALESLWRD